VAALMAMVNQRVESWVRDNPEQWLWLHNRWPN
jgi:KDO2-lipid IV(A) lauroyltransferase